MNHAVAVTRLTGEDRALQVTRQSRVASWAGKVNVTRRGDTLRDGQW